MGLVNTSVHAGADGARAEALLARPQALADAHAQDAAVAKLAWMGCLAAFALSLNSGPLRPQPLHAMAGFLRSLGGDDEVRQSTRVVIDAVIDLIKQAPAGDPLTGTRCGCGQPVAGESGGLRPRSPVTGVFRSG
ncbi:MAG: hypothetical protein R2712_03130 [Vicinamibacterales bacterium]